MYISCDNHMYTIDIIYSLVFDSLVWHYTLSLQWWKTSVPPVPALMFGEVKEGLFDVHVLHVASVKKFDMASECQKV